MSRIEWDKTGERLYETGVRNGVLYPIQSKEVKHKYSDDKEFGTYYSKAVAWNGLTSVSESPEGAEATDLYADDVKYLTLRSAETFGATVEAYMYPEEFEACDGTASLAKGITIGQQARKSFGLCYRTAVGNDTDGDTFGYKLHLIYGATVSPSEKAYQTVNDSPEAITFSWEMKTTPVAVSKIGDQEFKLTANLIIDTTKLENGVNNAALKVLEDVLYGTSDSEGYLPLPDEVVAIFADEAAGTLVTPLG